MEGGVEEGTAGRWRPGLYLVAVCCFFVQTAFVYLDYPRESKALELTDQGKEGLALWRKHNCQACHQFYGYGGFLGPDLTNLMSRRPNADLEDVLTKGRKQMPAFQFDEQQRAGLVAFLREVNETGTGIPSHSKVKDGVDPNILVKAYAEATSAAVPAEVLAGEQLVKDMGCNACHVPFAEGIQRAPDMSQSISVRGEAYVRDVVNNGKASMPTYDFLPDQLDSILVYLQWMDDNRAELGAHYATTDNGTTFNWSTVPWFEY